MNKILTTVTATIFSLQALLHSYVQNPGEFPKPAKRDEILKNYRKYEGLSLEEYAEIYDDADIKTN